VPIRQSRKNVLVHQLASRLSYPNPFTPSGIEFDLPDKALVTLKILDTAGREIRTLIDSVTYDPGTHHVDFGMVPWEELGGNPGEVYFYRLSAEYGGTSHVDTRKIVPAK
jgi:hypothetical protein